MKKLLLAGLALLATASFTFAQDAKTAANEKVEKVDPITEIASATGIKIFMVGDSTVSAFHDPYYYPRFGYGTKIQHFLTDKAEVVNLAMSGRSSKSFTTEANYETLKKYLKKGDYLIIGFGHNDEKAEEARYTNPNGAKEDAGSFKNSLYESYIKLALERKATPVLCTPIVRRAPGKAYEGAVVHVTADQGADFPGGDYPKAIRELASETKVALVDLTAKTKALYEEKGDDETVKYHAWLKHTKQSVDNTHLNNYGALIVAQMVVQDFARQNKKFAKLVNKNARAPAEADDLVQNEDYVIPAYTPFSPAAASTLFETTAPWYGTVFGDCGGQEKLANADNYSIIENGATVTMWAGSKDAKKQIGKIAAASDGIEMYFQQLPANADFTLTATATVTAIAKNNQVSFGLMARDDMYIDSYNNTIASNYVACAPYKLVNGDEKFSTSFMRKDGALTVTKTKGATVPSAGTAVPLSLTKKGTVYTVKYGDEPEVTYEVDLTEIDKSYIYVGLFAARAVNVDFSNVKLTVN